MIRQVTENKLRLLDLLLIGDEQENLVMQYINTCDLFVFEQDGVEAAVCAVALHDDNTLEIKNIAVRPEFQRRGIGRNMLQFVEEKYSQCSSFFLGTGDSPLTVPFYESCGFSRSGVIPDYFTQNYDHPIFEAGVQLRDMIIFKKLKP